MIQYYKHTFRCGLCFDQFEIKTTEEGDPDDLPYCPECSTNVGVEWWDTDEIIIMDSAEMAKEIR